MSGGNRLGSSPMRCVLAGVLPVAAFVACTEGAGPGDAGRGHLAKGSPWAVACMSQTPTATGADVGPGDGGVGPGSDGGMGSGGDGGMGSGSDGGMGSGSDGGMDCKGLDILESMIPLVPMGSASAQVHSITGFTDQLVSASISGAGFAFSTPGCSALACDFSAMPKLLPFSLAITCTATDGMPHGGLLTVQGAQGPSDTDSAILQCAGSASMPLISVAPPMLDAGNVAVGATKDLAFSVTNNGTATLTYSIELSPPLPEWAATAPGSLCLAPATCTVAPGGGSSVVGVRFAPATHGISTSSVSITSNAGPRTVDLVGTGVGSRIAVIDPADFDIDFGTIPRSSTANRTISVTAIGNLPVSISASSPGAPFAIAPPQLALSPGTPQDFTVSCSSATATPPTDRTITLDSPNAYALEAMTIAVHCEVANTQLAVAPTTFDFMERRKGTPRQSLPFTISNPGPFAANVTAVGLAGAPAPLLLAVDGGGFPRMLPIGGVITGRLDLDTEEDVDLAQTAPELEIAVDGEQLVYPVTGKVTTPSAYVTPEKLELGTACIGTQVSGTLMMINNGTARLTMERPEMDASFTPRFESPTSYPSPLLAGTMATLGVSPAVQAPGELSATLTWAVDAPRSPFVIPVSLAYIETGTAVSPASITVAPVTVGQISNRYTVTLQNCNAAPVVVTVDGVIATRGEVAAWQVQPRTDERTLAPQDKLTITVAFAPRRHGRHVAQIELGIDGEERSVSLEGDGIDPGFKRTSFYACACSSRGTAHGWPIVIAVAFVVLRRRRRAQRPGLALR